jgi:hypothetical protein
LRLVMLAGGRLFPNLVRRLMQRLLISGKQPAPIRFERELAWRNGHWQVRDRVRADNWSDVESLGIGGDQTSTYTVMSRTFQAGQLRQWTDLGGQLRTIEPGGWLTIERVVDP